MGAAGSSVVAVARRVGSLWKVHYETSGSQLGQFCPPGEHLAESGDTRLSQLYRGQGKLLASGG